MRRLVLAGEFHRELRLGVRTEVGHGGILLPAYVGKDTEDGVGEGQRERHVLLGVAAGVSEHHSLVARALLGGLFAFDSAVDVCALLVDGADDAAGIGVESVFGLGVAYLADHFAHRFLDVDVCVFGLDFASYDDEACGAERLARHLGLGVLAEEFIKDCI